ncbi:thioesterase family protein [Iamia majanohamensis]|uniref:Thioesterase family protein n=1 Tax=Iamia majanohamensis TaxID=467976 RepID=A0AAE9Y2R8_9ACTN|nr:thioesterase family protein [Iamia majanohamensis]WCO65105.1 thioesterase family protein [Iamia majanohamensis]
MGPQPFSHDIRVRYQEVDMQRVVFNAHYMAYCDETMAAWVGDAFGWDGTDDEVDWMLVRVEMDWHGSATYGDTLTFEAGVEHWGSSSFRVLFAGSVGDRPVLTARITYVCVEPGTTTKMAVPDLLRATLATVP